MTASEYAADAQDANLRYAGSIGPVDLEYTPVAVWPDTVNERLAAQEIAIKALREGQAACNCDCVRQIAELHHDVRRLQRSARILDRAYNAWVESNRDNQFWASVMESIGVENEREQAEAEGAYDAKHTPAPAPAAAIRALLHMVAHSSLRHPLTAEEAADYLAVAAYLRDDSIAQPHVKMGAAR